MMCVWGWITHVVVCLGDELCKYTRTRTRILDLPVDDWA